jgi:putative transposase
MTGMDPDNDVRTSAFSYIGKQYYSLTWRCHHSHRLFTQRDRVDLARAQFLRASTEARMSNIAYCFMPDHLHQVMKGDADDSDAKQYGVLLGLCDGYYFKNAFREDLWARKGFNRVLLDGDDPRVAVRYVLGNPVKARLVQSIEDYPFSGSETLSWKQLLEWAYGV